MINLIKKLFTKPPVIKYKLHVETTTAPTLERVIVVNTLDGKAFRIKERTRVRYANNTLKVHSLITGQIIDDYWKQPIEYRVFTYTEIADFDNFSLLYGKGLTECYYEINCDGTEVKIPATMVSSIETSEAVPNGKTHTLTKVTIIPV